MRGDAQRLTEVITFLKVSTVFAAAARRKAVPFTKRTFYIALNDFPFASWRLRSVSIFRARFSINLAGIGW